MDPAEKWFAVRFDPRHAAKSGMPGVVPVPADRIEEVRKSGVAREQAIDWMEVFIRENPEHELVDECRRFVEKAQLWDRAVEELQKGGWQEARERLEEILAVDPEDAAAQFNLGAAYRNLRRYDEALKAYEACEEVFTDEGLFFSNRGRTFLELGRTDEAVRDFEEALRLMPGDGFVVERLVELGALVAVYQDLDKPDEVRFIRRADFQEAVRRTWAEPGRDAEYYLQAARGHTAEGQSELAVEAAERAAALDPGNPETPLIRALALVALKRFDDAEESLLKHLSMKPDSPGAYAVLGRIQIAQGRADGARASLEKAVELQPNQPGAIEGLASLEPDAGAAIDRVRKLARKRPKSWAAWSVLASVLLKAERADEAFSAFESALAEGAGEGVLALYLSELGKAGRLERIAEIAGGLGDLSKRAESVRWTVAIALKTLGRKPEAAALLDRLAGDKSAHPAWRRQAQQALKTPKP